jgi:hypothetical protein
MRWYHWLILIVVFYGAGCALTDAQIDDIVRGTETMVTELVNTGIKVAAPAVPGLGLLELLGGGGLAGVIGSFAAPLVE